MASGSVYPSKDKWLTHSGGDTGGDGPEMTTKATGNKKVVAVKPIARQGQLLDSTGKMTKARALATGNDRSTRGSGR